MFFIPEIDLDNIANHLASFKNIFKNKTFLVTGGTGFIGKWLVAALNRFELNKKLNIDIYILTRDIKSFKSQFSECPHIDNIHFIEGDIRSLHNLDNLKVEFNYIILGANDATYDFSLNAKLLSETLIGGTFNLLDKFTTPKTEAIIHLSSGAVYGDISQHKNGAKETDQSLIDINNFGSMYGLSKALTESILKQYGDQNNIRIINARCFAFVGPYLPLNKHFAIGNFINNCLNSEPIVIQGNGLPVRSYMYAADMTKAILQCLNTKSSMTINIGSDEKISIKNLAILVSQILKNPNVVIKDQTNHHPEKANYYLPDVNLLKSMDYKESNNLETSIQKTYDFYNDKRV